MRILITILLLSASFNAQARSERCWLVSAEADTSIAAGAITTDAIDMSKGHRVDATKPIPSHLKIGLDLTDAGSGVSSLVLTFTAAEALAGTYRVVTEDAGSTAIVLSYDWDPSTAGKNWMIDVPWSSPFGKVTATPTGHGAGDTLQMTIYGCTGDPPPRSPAITETGLVTADMDLDTGGYQLILDDGATGAGNGAMYFGQDTDLSWRRVGANTLGIEGGTALTLRLGLLEQATDAAVAGTAIIGPNAYSQAETNTAGGPLYLGGGVGTKEIKIVQASASGSTLTFVVDGTSTTITADTEWNCTTDDATCCAELETYLDANIAGFTATCDTVDEVYLDPATTTRTLELTSADAAGTKFVVVNGDPGGVKLGLNQRLIFDSDGDTYATSLLDDQFNIYAHDLSMNFTAAATRFYNKPIEMRAQIILDANQDLMLGAPCDAAGTTGNVCFGGAKTTFDEEVQIDGNVYVAASKFVALDGGKFYPDKDDASVSVTTTGVGVLDLNGTPLLDNYTRHHDVPIGAAIVGAAAPAVETIGTFRCYVFDANADLAHISVEVPSEWNGSSDMAIDVLIFTDQGDALGNGEVIEFDLVYRSVDEGEAYDNGTAVTINANVTGGASEVDKGQYKITATVDYDDTDQPLAVNDTLGFSIMRDVTTGDTYSGDVHVCRAQLVYTANALATH